LLATGGDDGTARLWDVRAKPNPAAIDGHSAPVFALTFSSDSQRFATRSVDGTVRVWSARRMRCLETLPAVGWGPVCLSPTGRMLAIGAGERIRLRDLLYGRETVLQGGTAPVTALAFSPHGRLATGSAEGTVKLWTLDPAPRAVVLRGHRGQIQSMSF